MKVASVAEAHAKQLKEVAQDANVEIGPNADWEAYRAILRV